MVDFDTMAAGYDTDRRANRAIVIADAIRSRIAYEKGLSAMEFGCGTGLVGMNFIDVFESLTFLDSSRGMIEQVIQKIANYNNPNLSAVCCDILADTTFSSKFNYIFSSLVLHHIPGTSAILARLAGALHSGGHLIIVELDADDGSFHANHPGFDGHNGFEQDALANLARSAGFSSVDNETFYNGIKTVDGVSSPYSLFIMDAVK